MKGEYLYVPLDVAQTPIEGHVYVNRWWSVHKEKGVCFYAILRGYYANEEPSPQCNANEATARALNARLRGGDDYEIMFLPVVYAHHAMRAMNAAKAALKSPSRASDVRA
jgi:hypothetical protein